MAKDNNIDTGKIQTPDWKKIFAMPKTTLEDKKELFIKAGGGVRPKSKASAVFRTF